MRRPVRIRPAPPIRILTEYGVIGTEYHTEDIDTGSMGAIQCYYCRLISQTEGHKAEPEIVVEYGVPDATVMKRSDQELLRRTPKLGSCQSPAPWFCSEIFYFLLRGWENLECVTVELSRGAC